MMQSKIRRRGETAPLCKDPVPENQWASRFFSLVFIACVYFIVKFAEFLSQSANVSRVAKNNNNENNNASSSSSSSSSADSCEVYDVSSVSDYVLAAIPFFLFTMLVEFLILKFTKLPTSAGQYNPVDTWSSLAMGITQLVVFEIFLRAVNVRGFYCSIYTALHPVIFSKIPGPLQFLDAHSWLGYLVAILADDFVYYWFHRFSHEIGWMWAGHQIHHSSEHFNLSTALRQSWFQAILGSLSRFIEAPFFHPRVHFTVNMWVTIYQFYFHTCTIRRFDMFPLFEYVMNTPTHHRVHHDRRVHKNFGGVLILWDRIFGTFRDERECDFPPEKEGKKEIKNAAEEVDELCLFGIYDQVKSWTEAVTQIQWLVDHGLKHPIALWKGPGYFTTTKERRLPAKSDEPRFRQDDRPRGPLTNWYLAAYFVWALYSFVIFKIVVAPKENPTVGHFFVSSAFVLVGLLIQGFVADRNYKTATVFEIGRLLFAVLFSRFVVGYSVVACAISILWIALIWDRARQVPSMTDFLKNNKK